MKGTEFLRDRRELKVLRCVCSHGVGYVCVFCILGCACWSFGGRLAIGIQVLPVFNYRDCGLYAAFLCKSINCSLSLEIEQDLG